MIFQEKEPKKIPNRITLQMRLKADEKEALQKLADENKVSVSEFIKKAVNVYAKQLEQQKKGE